MGAFGEKLRKQREQRGLALDAISNTTKISTRMLRALEDEHFDQLPGGVFNKGFVRAYARQVGLNEEEAITEYLAALRESQVQSQQILPDFRSPGNKPAPRNAPDARHHILPASDHPGGIGQNAERDNDKDRDKENAATDLAAAERRRAERRNEVRRSQDRDLPKIDPGQKVPFFSARSQAAPPVAPVGTHDDRDLSKRAAQPDTHTVSRTDEGVHGYRDENARAFTTHDKDTRDDDALAEDKMDEDRIHPDRRRDPSPSMSGFITLAPGAEIPAEPPPVPSQGISRIRLGAALLAIVAIVVIWISYRHHESASHSEPAAGLAASSPAPQTPLSAATASPEVAATASAAKPTPEKSAAVKPVAAPKAAPTAAASTPVASPGPESSGLVKSAASESALKPPPTFRLLIRADQTTWIAITADGKPVTRETLIAPAHTSVKATQEIAVRVGNAAGVSFELNGKEFPAEGNVGEVKTYLFGATGLKPSPQTTPQSPMQ